MSVVTVRKNIYEESCDSSSDTDYSSEMREFSEEFDKKHYPEPCKFNFDILHFNVEVEPKLLSRINTHVKNVLTLETYRNDHSFATLLFLLTCFDLRTGKRKICSNNKGKGAIFYICVDRVWKVRPMIEIESNMIQEALEILRAEYLLRKDIDNCVYNEEDESSISAFPRSIISTVIFRYGSNTSNLIKILTGLTSVDTKYEPYHPEKRPDPEDYNICPPIKASLLELKNLTARQLTAIDKFVGHIKMLCFEKEDAYNYLISWITYILSDLGKTNTLLILLGDEGCGKSTIFEFLTKMVLGMDSSFMALSISEDLFDKFNGHLECKRLVYVDDAGTGSGMRKTESCKLRTLVTSSTFGCRHMWQGKYEAPNLMSLVLLTNNVMTVSMSQQARRESVIDCSDKKMGDKEYFDDLYSYLEDQDCANAIYSWLRLEFRNSKDFVLPKRPYCNTKVKEEIQEMSMNTAELFHFKLTTGEYEPCFDQTYGNDEFICVDLDTLFKAYITFCNEEGIKNAQTKTKFVNCRSKKTIFVKERKTIGGKSMRVCIVKPEYNNYSFRYFDRVASDMISRPYINKK